MGSGGNNVPADCKIRLRKTCFRSVHVRCWCACCLPCQVAQGGLGGGGGVITSLPTVRLMRAPAHGVGWILFAFIVLS